MVISHTQRLAGLRNFNTLFAVVAALNSSTISRLKKTWDNLSSKYRASVESLRRLTDHSRNYSEYRQQLRASHPPALPFLGLSLTDLTFCYEGNQASRVSPLDSSLRLINFDRYQVRRFASFHSDARRNWHVSSATYSAIKSRSIWPNRPRSNSGSISLSTTFEQMATSTDSIDVLY